ncbi:hypothetical protein Syun_004767 [Stephania yunnanensis]|uniref:Uncharacterized protein n=1 Tax=Stephania yunnanensis TaxID=152371 RepID=A0AAP0L4K7_9MAGN
MQIKGDLMLQIEELSIEVIKPSTPTPAHLKTHKFSLLDQYYGHGYLSVPLFYSSPTNTNASQIIANLKTSLAKSLTLFYPLAGRIKDDYNVECNDEGVKFVHAQVRHCSLSQALTPAGDHLSQLFPKQHTSGEELLGIQVSFFECGGIAIGAYLSHKIMDAHSVCTFMLRWAKIASCGVDNFANSPSVLRPRFDSAYVFPPTKATPLASEQIEVTTERVVFKVFRIEGSKIAALKARAKSCTDDKYPSKMMAVTAFLWTIFGAIDKQRRCRLAVAASLRRRLRTDQSSLETVLPIMHKNTMGNSAVILLTPPMVPTSDFAALPDLVKVVEDTVRGVDRRDDGGEISKMMESFFEAVVESNDEGELGVYEVSSWLRLPFYEADFGWGRPVWFVALIQAFKNVITYFETRCGEGVEVLVWMTEEDMARFESVPELLEFVAPVLSVA